MTKEQSIKKAKKVMCELTSKKWTDIPTLIQMQERLTGILDFVSTAFPLTYKELDELNFYKDTRLNYWQNLK